MGTIPADTARCRYCPRKAAFTIAAGHTLTCDGHMRRGTVLAMLELDIAAVSVAYLDPYPLGELAAARYVNQARHPENSAHALAAEQGTTTPARRYPPLCSRGHELTEPGAPCLQCRRDANNERRAAYGQR